MVSFPLFGFRVTISPTFLILGLFLLDSRLGAGGLAAWVGAAFSSVLIHELGHAFAVRRAGGVVEGITLHALGGATAWADPAGRIGWGRRIGLPPPGPGLDSWSPASVRPGQLRGLWPCCRHFDPQPLSGVPGRGRSSGLWGVFFLGAFIWVTIAWGLVNWLPIGGLDGWHILAELLERWMPGRGRRTAAVIGLLVALGAGWFLFQLGIRFGAVILVFFAIQTLMSVRDTPAIPTPPAAPRLRIRSDPSSDASVTEASAPSAIELGPVTWECSRKGNSGSSDNDEGG